MKKKLADAEDVEDQMYPSARASAIYSCMACFLWRREDSDFEGTWYQALTQWHTHMDSGEALSFALLNSMWYSWYSRGMINWHEESKLYMEVEADMISFSVQNICFFLYPGKAKDNEILGHDSLEGRWSHDGRRWRGLVQCYWSSPYRVPI